MRQPSNAAVPRRLAVVAIVIGLGLLATSEAAWAGTKALVNKVVITPDGALMRVALPVLAIEAIGATLVEDYDEMAVVDLGPATADALAKATGLGVSPLPNHDKIFLPSLTLDAAGGLPSRVTAPAFPASSPNLYLVVLRSMPKPEWIDTLKAAGADLVSYVPENTYLVWTTLANLSSLRGSGSFVTNVIPFVPSFRLALDGSEDDAGYSYVIVTALAQASDALVGEVQSESLPGSFGSAASGRLVNLWGRVPTPSALSLAFQPEVVSVSPMTMLHPSGEREALITAGLVGTSSPFSPSCGASYYSWLTGKGMATASDIQLGLLDTGLDTGTAGSTNIHPDFKSGSGASRVAHSKDYSGQNVTADCVGHGTLVAATMAAAGGVSAYNTQWAEGTGCSSGSFFAGLGIVPSAQLSSAKFYDDSQNLGQMPFSDAVANSIFSDFSNWGVWVANLSSNEGATSPNYSHLSSLLDAKVRATNIAIVVSAGNSGSSPILPPATAKNVIAVGGSENCNPYQYNNTSCFGQWALNSHYVMGGSSFGPASDGRIKPELVAPGSAIMGAMSLALQPAVPGSCIGSTLCYPAPYQALMGTPGADGIAWDAGTSFSAPLVAGAAGLAAKWYKTGHGGSRPSPAMIKAMLVNSALDISDGYYDNRPGQFIPLGHIPSPYQGWGKLDLTRAFPAAGNYFSLDQTWLFPSSGANAYIRSLTVRDPSKPVRVTLVWTDKEALDGAGVTLVNDLNMLVGNFMWPNFFVGNSFDSSTGRSHQYPAGQTLPYDHRNNVEEVVFVPSQYGLSGFYVQVWAQTIGNPPLPGGQDFALFVENAY